MTGSNFKFLDRNPEHDPYLAALIEKYYRLSDERRELYDKWRDEYGLNDADDERYYKLGSQIKFIQFKMYNRYHTLVHGDYDRIHEFKKKYLID